MAMPLAHPACTACQETTSILQVIHRCRHAVHAAVIVTIFFGNTLLRSPEPIPMHPSILTGQRWLDELLNGHPQRCLNQLGMYPASFCLLWWEMVTNGGLVDGRFVRAVGRCRQAGSTGRPSSVVGPSCQTYLQVA